MTPYEEKKLYEALRGPVIYAEPFTNDLMETTATEDLHAITPTVDEMLRNAEHRGRLKAILERWAKAEEMREKREKAAA